MPTAAWVVLIVLAIDAVLVPLLLWALIKGSWQPIATKFPAHPPAPDAVEKLFQSYRIGLFNLGFMIHTAVDDRFLHLRPAWLGRLLRMQPASVPWDRITPLKRKGRRYAEVKIDTANVLGPRWALELAFADAGGEGPGDTRPQAGEEALHG